MRAFTAKDRKEIKQTAENYPISPFYKTDEILTSLGIGEALVTALNEKGIPTPLAATYMRAPMTRMDILSSSEIDNQMRESKISSRYEKAIDSDSAYEILNRKIQAANEPKHQEELIKANESLGRPSARKNDTLATSLSKNTMVRQVGRVLARELARGLLGALGVSNRRR